MSDVASSEDLPTAGEQTVIQGGHLLLSAAAGAVYALTVDEEAGVVRSGIGFGLAFYVTMHWITGPLLGVTEPEWRADRKMIGMHAANHIAFEPDEQASIDGIIQGLTKKSETIGKRWPCRTRQPRQVHRLRDRRTDRSR